jgi:predicted transcriptional regulator of viral defense system
MEKIVQFINKKGGYATMSEMRKTGIHPRIISEMTKNGQLEKVKRGLYRLADFKTISNFTISFQDVCKAEPWAIICLLSAAEYYQMTTFNPSEIYVAIPRTKKPKKIIYPPVKHFYFSDKLYKNGVLKIKTRSGYIKIFDKEKTICDLFRYIKRIGEDTAIESLNKYLSDKKSRNINKLIRFAKICNVEKQITPYIKSRI